MKTKCLCLLLPLLLCGCSNSGDVSSTSSIEDFTMPNFAISFLDSRGAYFVETLEQDNILNLNSRYRLVLEADKNQEYPSFKECSFKYDHQYLDIIDCVFKEQNAFRFIWQIKPLKVVETTKIELYYHGSLCDSFNVTIKDESVDATSCASTIKNLDFAASDFIDEITVFNDLTSYETFMNKHNYFGYIKNTPNASTFENYEYAFVCISNYSLGNDPALNSVFIQNNALFYDFISSKSYFEEPPDIPMMTAQNYYLSLIRYPSGLSVSSRYVFLSYDYIAEE